MDGSRFDALVRAFSAGVSRRDLSRLVGAVALGPSALLLPSGAGAKRKKGKTKRKKKGGSQFSPPPAAPPPAGAPPPPIPLVPAPPPDPCPGRKLCNGECIPSDQCCTREDCPPVSTYRCCNGLCTDEKRDAGRSCDNDTQCCSDYCRLFSSGLRICAATCRGRLCTLAGGCCRGFACLDVDSTSGFGRCGGCADAVSACESDADCCFSACTARPGEAQKRCLSYAGGPCEKPADCRSCFVNGECTVMVNGTPQPICTNGVCGCPDDCCEATKPCPGEQQLCVRDDDGLNGVCRDIVP